MSKIAFLNTPAKPAAGPVGMKGFFAWLRAKQPNIYRATMSNLSPHLGEIGFAAPDVVSTEAPVGSNLADKIKDIVLGVSTAYLSAQQLAAQRTLLNTQLKRAQQGLAPLNIDPAAYGITGPQVRVGMSDDTKQLLIYGGVAAVAVYLIFRRK